MLSIFKKEITVFFSSLIGYVVIGVFLTVLGLFMFVIPDTSLLNDQYATLDPLFEMAPAIFMFLIPAVTMRSFAEEQQAGTFELLATRPLHDLSIIGGKYLAALALVAFALLPTLLYYYTIYELGAPRGNMDSGAIWGSYIGLLLLAACFVAIGVFASTLTTNQIVAFVAGTFLCFVFHWGFHYLSKFPVFVGKSDAVIEMFGIDYHYKAISRGIVDTRNLVYYFSLIAFFGMLTLVSLERRKW